ncbi:MAG: hypothetical protein ACYTDU_15560 [Planctomycetota bacterium]|jgi:hypothetical protein
MARPPKSWIALLAFLPAAFMAGRLSFAQEESPPKKPETVKALRYTILWAESALEITHGGGQWVHEIYFPERKVACVLTFQYPKLTDLSKPGGGKRRPRLYAYPADRPRNDLTGFENAKPSAIEEVEVPTEVAQEIFRLAELSMRQERETWRLGREVAHRGLMKELPRAVTALPK